MDKNQNLSSDYKVLSELAAASQAALIFFKSLQELDDDFYSKATDARRFAEAAEKAHTLQRLAERLKLDRLYPAEFDRALNGDDDLI